MRRPAQVEQLRALGAEHVVDSSAPAFADDLVAAIAATRATLAFDAIGGGPLASQILAAMERVAARDMTTYSHYGSATHKQVYIYGSLDRSPTMLVRSFGLAWSVGGYLVSHALRKLGTEAYGRMTRRVMSELTTTFHSHYHGRISLAQLRSAHDLQPELPIDWGEGARLDTVLDAVRGKYGAASVGRAAQLGRDPGWSAPLLP